MNKSSTSTCMSKLVRTKNPQDLLPHNLLLVNKEPILVELLDDLLGEVRSVDQFVHMPLPPLFHPLLQCLGRCLQTVVRDLGEEQMVDDVAVHHVVRHPIDPFAIVAIDRLERTALKGVGIVCVELPILRVVLQVRDHEQPERQYEPRHHAHDGKVGGPHGRPKSSGRGEGNSDRKGSIGLLLQRMALPHAPVKEDVSAIGNAREQIHKVQDGKLQVAGEVTRLEQGVELLALLADEPLVRVVLLKVIVVQMMLAMRQRPRNEGGQTDDGMRDFTHDAIDPLSILCDGAMSSVVSNTPHAPGREKE